MIYYLSNGPRIFVYTFFLVGFVLQSYITVLMYFRRTSFKNKIIEILFLIVHFFIVGFAGYILSEMTGFGVSYYIRHFFILLPLFILILLRTIFRAKQVINAIENEITPFSILESIDKLGSGLLVYDETGQIILKNEAMSQMLFSIFNKEYRDGNLLWNEIIDYSETLLVEEEDTVLIKNGEQTYEFCLYDMDIKGRTYKELVASDVSKIYNLVEAIEKKNLELEKSYVEVDKMLKDLNEIVDIEERISMKVHLHDSLGHQFTILRTLLNNYSEENVDLSLVRPLEILENLRRQPEKTPEETIDEIRDFFNKIGISIEENIEIVLPDEIKNVFSLIAIEGITNAIIHGNANWIGIRYYEENNYYCMSIKNDGISSTKKIIEGGGIKGMKYRLKPYNGILKVKSEKPFTIFAKINKDY